MRTDKIKGGLRFLALTLTALIPSMTAAQAVSSSGCPASGPASVGALHREWILVGWEKQVGDGPFIFREKLGKYYDFSANDVVLYDDFDPQKRVAHSAKEYGSFWEPSFSALRSVHHRVVNGPDVASGSGGLAASTLEFEARIEAADGNVTNIRTRSSLVWRCSDAGWKIIREHNSSVVLPSDAPMRRR
ncbi:YybH family protein [Archangium violaceum]|uniref:YybH family protein n=1 Tax=Archangium violaceum TaxID=83451 RepID=UPI0037C0A760